MWIILFHLLLTIGTLWFQKAQGYRIRPLALNLAWFAVSVILVFIEMAFLTGQPFSTFFLHGVFVSVFQFLPLHFALRDADKRRAGIWRPFFLYLVLGLIAVLLVALIFARADTVKGIGDILKP
jgi:hypothetical protein